MEQAQREWTDEMEEKVMEYFQLCDVDKSQTISVREVKTAAQLLGYNPTNDEVNKLLSDEDENGDGVLNYSEFRSLVMKFTDHLSKNADELEEALNVFMEKHSPYDEYIDMDEFKHFLKTNGDDKLTEEEINSIFKELDKSNDNKLDKEELMRLLSPLP